MLTAAIVGESESFIRRASAPARAAPRDFFDRHNQQPNAVRSIIGSHAAQRM